MNILVIQKDTVILSQARHLLESARHIVTPCADTNSGFEAMKRRQDYDMIIAGLGIGEPNGMDLLAFAKKHIPTASTMLTMVTHEEPAVNAAKIFEIDYVILEQDMERAFVTADLIPPRVRIAKYGEPIIKS